MKLQQNPIATANIKLLSQEIELFQTKVWQFYKNNKRNFIWRENITPYNVFVSEVMLQQTQTSRVIPKFEQWIDQFGDFTTLAHASVHQVLHAWQGLGYNRRGLALHASAKKIMQDFGGQVPQDLEALQTLPGIGPNTAASSCAFAFNLPVVFIETNIRTVFLHEFFSGKSDVSDKQLLHYIQASLDLKRSRDWYYALMDYGVYLKKELRANNKNSKHYTVQSRFVGSRRQVRGAIVRILTKNRSMFQDELYDLIRYELPNNHHDVAKILQKLIDEKLVSQDGDQVFI